MSALARKPRRLMPLQAVIALVFTALTVAIAGGLVLYNHAQLTRFAKREAHSNFTSITRMIRSDRQASARTAEMLLETLARTVDPDMPGPRVQIMLLELMDYIESALPSTSGILMARPDGSLIEVQDLTRARPKLLDGLGGGEAVFGVNINERGPAGGTEHWILYSKDRREVARTAPVATDYDPRNREWYQRATTSSRTIMSQPYAFANSEGSGFTIARGVPERPGFVFGIDITLADLDKVLAEGRRQSPAEPVIFDQQGRLVSHPEGESYRGRNRANAPDVLPKLAELGSPLLAAMGRSFAENGYDKDVHFEIGRDTYLARFEQAGGVLGNFVIGLAVPESVMMGEAYRIRTILLMAAALALVIALVMIFLAARRVVRPIRLATQDLDHIVELRFGRIRPVRSRIVEVADLGRAVATLELVLQNFSRYVPFALVRGMIDRSFSTELGGKRQPICVMFSDIEGFTGLAETLDPDALTRQTSRYFGELGDEVVRSGGTIDKYIGDAVMAFWNAPEAQEDFVRLACIGVLRAARRVECLNAAFAAEGLPAMTTRFGLHTGEAVVGNVGTIDRMNYTALGHTVNLASRLEGLNRDHHTTILVSEAVVEAAGADFCFRPVGETIPRGASRPIRIFELLGAHLEDAPDLAPDLAPQAIA